MPAFKNEEMSHMQQIISLASFEGLEYTMFQTY